ncbi:trehalase-domain-containing protein [Chytridium lagenaria]|nr:trehalase-domain-containing protein [Chytridium lagenaria]
MPSATTAAMTNQRKNAEASTHSQASTISGTTEVSKLERHAAPQHQQHPSTPRADSGQHQPSPNKETPNGDGVLTEKEKTSANGIPPLPPNARRLNWLDNSSAARARRLTFEYEDDLKYHDSDHRHAHGVESIPKLLENMAVAPPAAVPLDLIGEQHPPNIAEGMASKNQFERRRRTSHDDFNTNRRFLIDVSETKRRILEQEDTNNDSQITIEDLGPKAFTIGTANSGGYNKFELRGHYIISNLLQELALATDHCRKVIVLDEKRLNENPVDRLNRVIKYHFWEGLSRRIDADGLAAILTDIKMVGENRIYVPFNDEFAYEYYCKVAEDNKKFNLNVIRLPEIITPQYVKSLHKFPGILALALRRFPDPKTGRELVRGAPFVVPGGRFNEMYARAARLPLNPTDLKVWLARSTRAAVKELLSVWLSPERLDPLVGLSKYRPDCVGIPPETEPGHFEHILEKYAKKLGIPVKEYEIKYSSGEIREPELDEYFLHDGAVRESGHDTTYRFDGVCANLATIDLNCLVYKYEQDLQAIIDEEFGGSLKFRVRRGPNDIYLNSFKSWLSLLFERGIMVYDPDTDAEYRSWVYNLSVHPETGEPSHTPSTFTVILPSSLFASLAKRCKGLINKFLWSDEDSMFYDYDCAREKRENFQSVTTLWSLWCGVASEEQASKLISKALPLFEVTGGLVSGTLQSRGPLSKDRPSKQWDYPYGWAPHQMLVWEGLMRYGRLDIASRLAYRWLFTIIKAFADFNGVVPEKFDFVVREGFGWMNASYQIGLSYLTVQMRRALGTLTPPDKLFDKLAQLAFKNKVNGKVETSNSEGKYEVEVSDEGGMAIPLSRNRNDILPHLVDDKHYSESPNNDYDDNVLDDDLYYGNDEILEPYAPLEVEFAAPPDEDGINHYASAPVIPASPSQSGPYTGGGWTIQPTIHTVMEAQHAFEVATASMHQAVMEYQDTISYSAAEPEPSTQFGYLQPGAESDGTISATEEGEPGPVNAPNEPMEAILEAQKALEAATEGMHIAAQVSSAAVAAANAISSAAAQAVAEATVANTVEVPIEVVTGKSKSRKRKDRRLKKRRSLLDIEGSSEDLKELDLERTCRQSLRRNRRRWGHHRELAWCRLRL